MEVENLQTGELSDKAVCGCTATSIRLFDDKNHLISATHYDYQSGHLPNIPFKRTCPASSSPYDTRDTLGFSSSIVLAFACILVFKEVWLINV